MRKQRRIKKEDISDPSNFVHVKHVGFGSKASPISTQRSLDLDTGHVTEGSTTESPIAENGESEPSYAVERRSKVNRASLIPRHHRSTTTCIFPTDNSFSLSRRENKAPIESHRGSMSSPGENKSSLKPTFGSLLNLSFLPLGLGKTSSKSPSINKTKRMSLLNLTSGNLFANPKGTYEENPESVHMTGYYRRRSRSNSQDENTDNEIKTPPVKPARKGIVGEIDSSTLRATTSKSSAPTRIPLSKLGRSKSTMAEFTKRPKLRLKIVPPPQPPPPVPSVSVVNTCTEAEEVLPSPPPSPIPSPPPSPIQDAPTFQEEVAVLRSPKTTPRPRIIPLPSTSSVDSADPSSPQYLTPAGGCSPVPNNESNVPVLLSPTIPPSSTPFFSSSRNTPGTPPVWPLQPAWPSTISMQRKEATIPEIPSPCKEEMETSENEYGPVLSIVESFFPSQNESPSLENGNCSDDKDLQNGITSDNDQRFAVTSSNINSISSVLQENIGYVHWPRIAQKLFDNMQNSTIKDNVPCSTAQENQIYGCLLTKTLELWQAKAGDEAILENLMRILDEENHHKATDSLREVFQSLKM